LSSFFDLDGEHDDDDDDEKSLELLDNHINTNRIQDSVHFELRRSRTSSRRSLMSTSMNNSSTANCMNSSSRRSILVDDAIEEEGNPDAPPRCPQRKRSNDGDLANMSKLNLVLDDHQQDDSVDDTLTLEDTDPTGYEDDDDESQHDIGGIVDSFHKISSIRPRRAPRA